MPRALTPFLMLTLLLPACGLFAGGRPIVTGQSVGCSSLIPDNWKAGVEGADLPTVASSIGEWIAFGDEQTGRLDMANDRTTATIGIVERCEQRDAEAIRRATRRGLFGG